MFDGGDPYRGGGPYRDRFYGPCPRCGEPLAEELADSTTCTNRCGEWLSVATLSGAIDASELDACEPDVGSLIGRPFPPAECAVCAATMEVRIKRPVVFDFCRAHGVWLDRGERAPFETAFGLRRKVVGA
jgi:hypothetical protein